MALAISADRGEREAMAATIAAAWAAHHPGAVSVTAPRAADWPFTYPLRLELPASPVLILRLETSGLLSLAGPALRFLDALPPGIRVEHDRIYVDLAKLLAARHLESYLAYVKELRVNAVDGAVLVSIRGRL